ncbi:ferrochelatase [Aquihabitans daechungensis]|uniref:ferrochelatase n=1 Tax=Aquihabitans daechungensis TaxID=1052257 RepID=UPI003B9E692D
MTADPGAGPIGVVLMAYGTPATPADVEPYYTHIRRGRPPTPEQLANLQMRYDALGGTSTLAARTADQVAGITAALERLQPGGFVTALGQKHAFPFIEDGVAQLADQGVRSVIGVVLAPHYSGFSVGEYQARVAAAAADAGLPATGIERWHDLPEYRAFLAGAVAAGLRDLPPRTEVVFTAHSLPERVLADDPYPDELRASAEAVAGLAGIRRREAVDGSTPADDARWSIAWQSAGATPGLRRPDILDVIRERAQDRDVDGILVCPQGFVSDHLEVAYDLDIEAARVAAEAGIAFARTQVLNDDPTVLTALAARIAALVPHTPVP